AAGRRPDDAPCALRHPDPLRHARRSAAGFLRRSPCSAPRDFRSWTISLKRTKKTIQFTRMVLTGFYTRWRPGETKKRGPRPRFSHPRKRLVLALVDDLVGRDPRHHGAQLLADHLDLVSGVVATVGGHRRVVGRAFGDE